MSHANAMSGIQAGLINYLGAAQDAIPEEGLRKNRSMVAMLMDLIIMTSKPDHNKPCHMGILEPVIQGLINILKQQQSYIATVNKKDEIITLEEIICDIEKLKDMYQDQMLGDKPNA